MNMHRYATVMLAATILAVGAVGSLAADEHDDQLAPWDEYSRALGISSIPDPGAEGLFPVPALSYQRWRESWGWQGSLGVVYGDLTGLQYGASLQTMFPIFGRAPVDWYAGRLYWWLGAAHTGRYLVTDQRNFENVVVTPAGTFIPSIVASGGIGVESVLWRNISIPLDLGYAAGWYGKPGGITEQITVGFTANIALRYRY